jgi:hypothetical protein
LSLKIKVDDLLVVWPQNQWDGFLRFGFKIGGDSFSRFSIKTGGSGFLVCASKLAATVWWFEPQNHLDGFWVWASKPSRLRFIGCATKSMGGWVDAGHTTRSSGLLRVEASQARVFQSDIKTDGGAMADGARGTIVEVVW